MAGIVVAGGMICCLAPAAQAESGKFAALWIAVLVVSCVSLTAALLFGNIKLFG